MNVYVTLCVKSGDNCNWASVSSCGERRDYLVGFLCWIGMTEHQTAALLQSAFDAAFWTIQRVVPD